MPYMTVHNLKLSLFPKYNHQDTTNILFKLENCLNSKSFSTIEMAKNIYFLLIAYTYYKDKNNNNKLKNIIADINKEIELIQQEKLLLEKANFGKLNCSDLIEYCDKNVNTFKNHIKNKIDEDIDFFQNLKKEYITKYGLIVLQHFLKEYHLYQTICKYVLPQEIKNYYSILLIFIIIIFFNAIFYIIQSTI